MACLYCDTEKILARGMCGRHYKLWYKGKPLTNPPRKRCPISVNHSVYQAWENMKTRCRNPKSTQWIWYGARGIDFYERWDIFENFYEDMFGTWKEGLTLDRRDNELGYSKENCRWVTWEVQANNRRKRYDSRK